MFVSPFLFLAALLLSPKKKCRCPSSSYLFGLSCRHPFLSALYSGTLLLLFLILLRWVDLFLWLVFCIAFCTCFCNKVCLDCKMFYKHKLMSALSSFLAVSGK